MLLCLRITLVMLISLLFNATVAWSATLYISDQLVVSLRESPQNNSKTIVYLRTDTPVELLKAGKEYSKVKTAKGEIGYIQQTFLTDSSPKPIIIKRLAQENESLNVRIQELEKRYNEAFSKGDEAQTKLITELEALRAKDEKLQRSLNESNQELAVVTKAYEALKANAQNILAITNERNQLKLSHEKLTTTVTSLESERIELLKKEAIKWFIAGAGVLFLGWVLGKFSKSRRKGSLY